MSASRIASILSNVSGVALLIVIALAAIDISFSVPGVSHPIPRQAEPLMLWGPLIVSVLALLFTMVGLLRRESAAAKRSTWFIGAAISFLYAFVAVWNYFYPMRVY
jgi:hypothetical protein